MINIMVGLADYNMNAYIYDNADYSWLQIKGIQFVSYTYTACVRMVYSCMLVRQTLDSVVPDS